MMRTSAAKIFLLNLMVLVAACTAAVEPSADRGVREAGAEVLFWSQQQRDANFRQMERLFPASRVAAGGRPRRLAQGASLLPALGGEAAVQALMARLNIAGLLILQNGQIRLERYGRGFSPEQRWTSFSVAKSITSTLLGAAIADGYIKSLNDPVTAYLPELNGSAYDGVTIRQLLTMTSGVRWNEDYTDPASDVARMLVTRTRPGEDVTVSYMSKLARESEPGTKWVYKTGETNLVGVLVARATGKQLAQYLSEKLWQPYGMERDAYWIVDRGGRNIGGCCISASLRDYGRFGQFMLDGGRVGNKTVVSSGWIAEATTKQVDIGVPDRGYGYQWWVGTSGSFYAVGIFGQLVHIDPQRRLVIVTLSAWPQATSKELAAARAAMIEQTSAAADRSTSAPDSAD